MAGRWAYLSYPGNMVFSTDGSSDDADISINIRINHRCSQNESRGLFEAPNRWVLSLLQNYILSRIACFRRFPAQINPINLPTESIVFIYFILLVDDGYEWTGSPTRWDLNDRFIPFLTIRTRTKGVFYGLLLYHRLGSMQRVRPLCIGLSERCPRDQQRD